MVSLSSARFVAGIALVFVAFSAGAQLATTAPEFQVNTSTFKDQKAPDIARLADGRFVVVWQSYSTASFASTLIKAQGFDALGTPVGSEFQITELDWYIDDRLPKVAATATGSGFVVVWGREYRVGSTGSGFEVMARVANLDSVAFGDEILVTDPAAAFQIEPAVAVLPNSDFVVVWNDDGDAFATNLQGRRFNAAGTPQGSQFRVDDLFNQNRNNRSPAIAPQSDSSFMVVWESEKLDPTTDPGDVFAIRRNATGAALGAPFRVNETLPLFQGQPDIAAASDDSMLVVWGDATERYLFDTNIFARRLTTAGNPAAGEFQVNVVGYDRYDSDPAVDSTQAGDFVVVWARNEFLAPADTHGIVGAVVDDAGTVIGDEVILNDFPSVWGDPKQARPAVAVGVGGRVLATWDSDGSTGDDTSDRSVSARKATVPSVFTDGFESGDTSEWGS